MILVNLYRLYKHFREAGLRRRYSIRLAWTYKNDDDMNFVVNNKIIGPVFQLLINDAIKRRKGKQ